PPSPTPPTSLTSTLSLHDALPISFQLQGSLPSLNRGVGSDILTATPSTRPRRRSRTAPAMGITSRTSSRAASRTRRAFSTVWRRSEEHTSELQSLRHLVCRLLLVK